MAKRSRKAVALATSLWTSWDLGPGAVEARWTCDRFQDDYRWGWEVAWDDGPTVPRMRHAARQIPSGPAVGALVRADGVRYQRALTLAAWAASLVRHVRDGGQVPPLAEVGVAEAWRAALACTEFPERARTPREQVLAEVLVRRGLRDYRQALAAAERAWFEERRRVPAPAPPEVLLSRALATFGLEELAALEQAANVLEPLHRSLDLCDGPGPP